MGPRRALNAIGVAAALMQCPADSFLGAGPGLLQPRVQPGCKGSATASGAVAVCRRGRGNQGGSYHATSARSGLRRLAGWRLACSARGGHGNAADGASRREDAEMGSVDTEASAVGSRSSSGSRSSNSKTSSTSSSTTSGGTPTQQGEVPGERQGRRRGVVTSNLPPLPLPPPRNTDVKDPFDNRERAGFSLFRCDAYHCEREMVESGEISASAPATTQVMMRWNERPRRALVLLKPDKELLPLAAQTIDYLLRDMGLKVMVEAAAAKIVVQALNEFRGGSEDAEQALEVFTPPERSREAVMGPKGEAGPSPPLNGGDGDSVDFVLTLGGDGLLMYSNTLFQRSVPPHLCFNLGSMGFLTPFEYSYMKDEVRRIMTGGMKVSLRMRLSARIIRDDQTSEAFHALNEIVIDRGSSPYLTNLECYCDEQHLTTVQADGLIIATPTGSTAYSMSAGGSMVHPCVPAILFTPICPHSLSFRPIVFPDTVVLRLRMPQEARAEARVSFDGKLSQPLRRGDTLVIKTSNFPVPTICKDDSTADWFASLDQALGFNTRMLQRAFQAPSMEHVRTRNDDRLEE